MKKLTKLGKTTAYKYSKPDYRAIETFPNPRPSKYGDYSITFFAEEFTSLCPVTGQPDFGKLTIQYIPDKLCIESKSLKLYLGSYRLEKGFMEQLVNCIVLDLTRTCSPKFMKVIGTFNIRGGIGIKVESDTYRR